jgi:hypothetical protein
MPQFQFALNQRHSLSKCDLVQKKKTYQRGVLSRLDSNNPLVVEPESENDMARAGCPGLQAAVRDISRAEKFEALKRHSGGN